MSTTITLTPSSTYITESSLSIFLSALFPGITVVHDRKLHAVGFRPDYYLPSLNLVVEFDGFHHYTDNKIAALDIQKNTVLKNQGFSLVRIPYFVQLSEGNIHLLFREILNSHKLMVKGDFNSYPDGFIDSKAALPGRFSTLGLLAYQQFMQRLLKNSEGGYLLWQNITKSLISKVLSGECNYFECFPELDSEHLQTNCNTIKDYYCQFPATVNLTQIVEYAHSVAFPRDI